MEAFENSPEALVIKDVFREFFMGVIDNIKGAFLGFAEWMGNVHINLPPVIRLFGNEKINITLFVVLIAFMIFMNTKTYLMFKRDKRYAENDEERIPEFRLLLNMWLFGGIGGWFAVFHLRHKRRHRTFVWTSVFLMIVQALLFSCMFGYLGFWTFF